MTSEASARLALVQRYGRTSTAFRALGEELEAWFPASANASEERADAMVAFAAMPGAAVSAGEPIAPLHELVSVAEAFVRAQAAQGRRASFFATEGRLAQSPALSRRCIGEQPVWDPQQWIGGLRAHKSLREQLRRARAKGVTLEVVEHARLESSDFQQRVSVLQARWRATRSMPPMGFLVTQGLLEGASARRTWLARQGNTLVGILSLAPVPAREGWLFEHLLRDPDAPNGTAELLVDGAMRALATEGVRWATLGLAPLQGPIDPALMRVRRWSKPLFNFAGLSSFKRKLRPQHWEPMYLAWPVTESGLLAMRDGLRAFAGGSLTRFGIRTLLRGPSPLLQTLEWLLIPWLLLLSLAPPTPWFPSRAVQFGWILFDACLLLALRTLRMRTSRHGQAQRTVVARLAVAVATAVTLDAALTLIEAWSFRAPLTVPTWGLALTVIACTGPLLAAPMLWGAARRARLLSKPAARLFG